MPIQPNFDPIARPYRWLEYLTLGPALQRARCHFLPQLTECRSALVLGDGDGRFLAQLLSTSLDLQATAIDTSKTMLLLLIKRCAPHAHRLTTHHADALTYTPTQPHDLLCTHFFLDCLTQPQLQTLAHNLLPTTTLWLLTDFRIPPTGPLHHPARILIRALYLAFCILTGLRTTHLPDHETALRNAGFTKIAQNLSLAGLLTSELWQRSPASGRIVTIR